METRKTNRLFLAPFDLSNKHRTKQPRDDRPYTVHTLFNCKVLVYGCLICFLIFGPFSYGQDLSMSPNFILIFTDDQGWASTSVQMDDDRPSSRSDFYETPNIERLAQAGKRFSRGYASAAICSPSRRSLQFGQKPVRQGDLRFENEYGPEPHRHLTIPGILTSIDPSYQTAHYGKWDLRAGIYPEDLGYDESDGDTGNKDGNLNSNSITKWTEYFIHSNPKKINSLTGRAINFMERQVKDDHPFYLQVSHYATHVDIQATEKSFEKYWKKDPGNKHGDPGMAAMTLDLDEGIGLIIDKVHELGIEENTYILLMADNGGVELIPQTREKMIDPSKYGKMRRNDPLRGGKWTLYEGGIRVPFIVAGPGIEPGSQSNIPVVGWDILPTITDLASPEKTLPQDLDGVSFKNILKGYPLLPGQSSRPLIFHRYNNHYPHSAVILGEHKLIKHWKSGDVEVYNLSDDIGETYNLSDSAPSKTKELYHILIDYLKEVNAEILDQYNP